LDQCSKALDVKKMEDNIEIIRMTFQFIVCWPLSLPKRRSKNIKLWKVYEVLKTSNMIQSLSKVLGG
jgi:hypothetical protein